jgi:hypothetical protein
MTDSIPINTYKDLQLGQIYTFRMLTFGSCYAKDQDNICEKQLEFYNRSNPFEYQETVPENTSTIFCKLVSVKPSKPSIIIGVNLFRKNETGDGYDLDAKITYIRPFYTLNWTLLVPKK